MEMFSGGATLTPGYRQPSTSPKSMVGPSEVTDVSDGSDVADTWAKGAARRHSLARNAITCTGFVGFTSWNESRTAAD